MDDIGGSRFTLVRCQWTQLRPYRSLSVSRSITLGIRTLGCGRDTATCPSRARPKPAASGLRSSWQAGPAPEHLLEGVGSPRVRVRVRVRACAGE
jgi:hypothetical protein